MAKAAQPALFEEGEVAPMPGKIEQEAFAIYNDVAGRAGWTKAGKLSPERARKIKAAVREVGSLVEWRAALERGARSTFLTTKFRPDLEFVCRKPKIVKMSEGGFDDPGAAGPNNSLSARMGPSDEWAKRLRDHKPRGFWPVGSWGPRPDAHGCQAPPAMLEAWRKQHGITVAAPVTSTREQRLADMIVSYRKVGYYDRANALEEQLAVLEKRPAVLVPAPEVARVGMPDQSAEIGGNSRTNGQRFSQGVDEQRQFRANSAGNSRNPAENRRGGPITDVEPEWTDDIPEGAYGNAED